MARSADRLLCCALACFVPPCSQSSQLHAAGPGQPVLWAAATGAARVPGAAVRTVFFSNMAFFWGRRSQGRKRRSRGRVNFFQRKKIRRPGQSVHVAGAQPLFTRFHPGERPPPTHAHGALRIFFSFFNLWRQPNQREWTQPAAGGFRRPSQQRRWRSRRPTSARRLGTFDERGRPSRASASASTWWRAQGAAAAAAAAAGRVAGC